MHGHVCIFGYSDLGYAGDKGDRKFTTSYWTFIRGNLVMRRSMKQNVISRFNAEADYRAMTHTDCKMMWLKNLLLELDFRQSEPMPMFCDNKSAIYIAQNPAFHAKTKHIEVDYHLVRHTWTKKVVSPVYTIIKTTDDLLTKAASPKVFSIICSKLGMIDIYTPT